MASLLNAVIGEYRLVDFLGAGGMGEVYRAVHPKLGRTVAVKVLTSVDAKSVQRFLNEARIQARLRHPGIATLYDFTEFRGQPCIIMELVEGDTLLGRLRRFGPFAIADALAVFRKVVEAVAYVHAQGIVHRDLKSNNVKLTPAGEVKLLDFGIARAHESARLTQAGFLVGTAENLSPEQLEGKPADARSDIWALGVLLYEMLTGRLPFEAPNVAELYAKILRAPCPPPSSWNAAIPPPVDDLIMRCLKKRPAERCGSAEELLRELPGLASARARPAFHVSRRAALVAGGGVAVAAVAAGVTILLSGGKHDGGEDQAGKRPITIETIGGQAEVFQGGKRVGTTPHRILARMGDKVEMVLKRDGFQDLPVEFEVTERSAYSYTMEPAR